MIKFLIIAALGLGGCCRLFAQNVGIGDVNQGRARLEVMGVYGSGNTSAIFGGSHGISLQRNYPAIGFNQYRDDASPSTNGRYLGAGFAAVMTFVHDDQTLSKGLSLDIFPSGAAGALIPAGNRVWNISANNRFSILSPSGNALIDVGRGTSSDGTAKFVGSTHSSYFNHMAAEYTYIRGGLPGSTIYINDIAGGKVIFGTGGTRIGVNTAYYQPTDYTFEVRQSNGGLELSNASYLNLPWEWRVAAGSPARLYLYYAGSQKTYFSPDNGNLVLVSDGRLKTNVQHLPSVMDKLMQLQPVTYEMIHDNPGHVRSLGLLAQQVYPLFPELVSTQMPGGSDMLGLDYNGFVVLAIKGVQEAQPQILQLQQSLEYAAGRMKALEDKLASLKSKNKQP
jgi:hypothetical protein